VLTLPPRFIHPVACQDLVGPGGTLFLREIVEAYHVLLDPDRRTYTRGLRDASGQCNEAHAVCLTDKGSGGERALATDRPLNRINVIWSALDLLAGRVRQNLARDEPPQERRVEPIDVQLVVTAEQAMAGGAIIIEAPAYFPCPSCRGSGYAGGTLVKAAMSDASWQRFKFVRIRIPLQSLANHRRLEIPLRGLGIHHYYQRVHLTVAP
jgi:hypothetical protein